MTSWSISFQPLLDINLMAAVLVLLFLFIGAMEWRRKMGRRVLRLAALGISFLGLAGLLLRPHFSMEQELSCAVLLTKGYEASQADSLLKANPLLTVYQAPDAAPFEGAVELKSFHGLKGISESVDFVLGDGLPAYVFNQNSSLRYTYLPSKASQGIQSLEIPEELKANRINTLSGMINSLQSGGFLRWRGPEGEIDSVEVSVGSQPFSFSFTPKLPGRFIYQLELTDSTGVVQSGYKIPIVVARERQLSVLMVAQFPTFELRYLKNLLAEQGHSLALRYQLSKGKFRYEYANQPEAPFSRLTSDVLQGAHLLFIDQVSLASLSPQERSVLEDAIESGLGVLVGIAEQPLSQAVKSWLPFELAPQKQDTIAVRVTPNEVARLTASSVVFEPTSELNKVWDDVQGQIVAAYAYNGLGRVGSALWQDSYRLVLKGQQLTYATLWIELIDAVARKPASCCEIQLERKAPYYVDEPVGVTVWGSPDNIPELMYQNEPVPLKEDWPVENVWHSTIWPGKPGWDSLVVEEAAQPYYFFVHERPEWESLATAMQRKETLINASTQSAEQDRSLTQVQQAVPELFFYLLILLGFGGLWLAPKL